MKPLHAFLLFGCAIVLLGLLAVGVMISVSAGRPNWILIGVFAVDTLAIIGFATGAVIGRSRRGGRRPPP